MSLFVPPLTRDRYSRMRHSFSSRGTPSLLMVILAMDHLDEEMTRMSQDPKYDTSLRVALGLAKKTLNMYYDKTDMSDTYRISMGESYDI